MQIVYGVNPLLELLKQDCRRIKEIVVAAGRKGGAIDAILAHASANDIPVVFKDKSYLDGITDGNVHQGVAAWCKDYSYATLESLLGKKSKTDVILILDGVTDPQNLGSMIRTAHCLGAKGVIIPEDRAAAITPAVIKSSAGAVHWLPVVREVNLVRVMENLQKKGYWIYGADAEQGVDLCQFTDEGPVCLVMGSEGKGLRSLIRKKCDFLISIPMAGRLASLNVAVAAGIILFEIARKQGEKR